MKCFFLFLAFYTVTSSLNAQRISDSILNIRQSIVNSGFVCKWVEKPFSLRDPGYSIPIFSDHAETFSLREGIVKGIRVVNKRFLVLIESNDSVFVYSNLSYVRCEVGKCLRKGDLIGTISKDDEEIKFELEFGILVKSSRKSLNFIELFRFLCREFDVKS